VTTSTIKKFDLVNYKGFSKFTAHLTGSTYLVGPNNAGKSTLIHALRGCGHMIDHALAKAADENRRDDKGWIRAWSFPRDEFALVTENIRHEFSPAETRLELHFSNGNTLRAVWPAKEDSQQDEHGAFFYLESGKGKNPIRPKEVREMFPRIGIIPTLMPIDHSEQLVGKDHVRRHIDGRLASRHFRNQVHLLQERPDTDDYASYCEFVHQWTPEINITDLRVRMGVPPELDLFYREARSRTEKEIYWAGDGLQIWLQFLYHMHRLQGAPVVILDEPDVYLHADLQRRLVRMLRDCGAQTIAATHSLEIVAEAGAGAITFVDRNRRKTIRALGNEILEHVSETIGSHFNMRLARALRAKAVVFVEGKDMKLLRQLARTIGAETFANETRVAIIPLEGFSNWENVMPFQWFADNLLEKSVPVFIILDRDYRSDVDIAFVEARLKEKGGIPMVWKRKEIESYLLEIPVLQRATGAPEAWLAERFDEISARLRDSVLARFHSSFFRRAQRDKQDLVTTTELALKAFEELWGDPLLRRWMVPPKQVMSGLNAALAAAGHRTTSFQYLAKTIGKTELDPEVAGCLRRIEHCIRSSEVA
jgi:energy-coupling factor transporter ATP-binding protein EcfA2